jgi:hypothetical protein
VLEVDTAFPISTFEPRDIDIQVGSGRRSGSLALLERAPPAANAQVREHTSPLILTREVRPGRTGWTIGPARL